MKRLYPIIFALLIGIVFSSCDKEPTLEVFIAIGTIENADGKNKYDIRIDNGDLLNPTNSTQYNYAPENGQRVLFEYNVLEERTDEGSKAIKLIYLREILTKDIFHITPETEDSIGNDVVAINSMWIGSDYLNIGFSFFHYNQTHLFNLVLDEDKTYESDDEEGEEESDDKKIHLEFRHNANKDWMAYPPVSAYASYKLEPLQDAEADSVNLVIHVRVANEEYKAFELTYKYKAKETEDESDAESAPMLLKRFDNLIPTEDIK